MLSRITLIARLLRDRNVPLDKIKIPLGTAHKKLGKKQHTSMVTTIIRVSIIFIVLLLVIRLMGKKTLGEMQPFEFVITLVIAELACTPMTDQAIPLSFGIIPILVVYVIHFLIALLSRKSMLFRKMMNGSPIVVISQEGVEYKALRQLNMNLDDLIEATTTQGYFNLADISVAYFQTNGALTIIPTPEATPPTCGDLKIKVEQTGYAVAFIEDGKLCNLDKIGKSKDDVQAVLDKLSLDAKQITVATADPSGNVYIKPRDGKFLNETFSELAQGGS